MPMMPDFTAADLLGNDPLSPAAAATREEERRKLGMFNFGDPISAAPAPFERPSAAILRQGAQEAQARADAKKNRRLLAMQLLGGGMGGGLGGGLGGGMGGGNPLAFLQQALMSKYGGQR